ncbi:CopD family protein [Roseobacter sp.]|uniref:copper resistance D family protein n=1 Tax=Roseobacter sp. TaxID=1907202 RepID=UPI0025DDF098|nr:CopD family protein [Roseobacter sp.]
MEGLSPVDAWAITAIAAKAAGYGAALLAMGGPLFVAVFPAAPADARRLARQVALAAALTGLIVLALRFGIRAARISGAGVPGAIDPVMLGIVWESPLGTAATWRAGGEVLILALALKTSAGKYIALVGALLVAASFTFVGHSLGDPRWGLALLLTCHLFAAAFWVGALAPLSVATRHRSGAELLHRFGRIAVFTVAALGIAGLGFAWLMTGSASALFTTAYGRTLLVKLAVVAGLMLLAARNKWRLVPDLASGAPGSAHRLRRSIAVEAVAVCLILLATATLTSVTTPPVNL